MIAASLKALLDLLKNADLKRSSLTTLEGATRFSAANATVIVATALGNTAGVIIRILHGWAGASNWVRLHINSARAMEVVGTTGNNIQLSLRDVRIQSGVLIAIESTSTSGMIIVYAETL